MWDGDQRSKARSWGWVMVVGVLGDGKVKSRAMPASEQTPMKGMVRRSAPRETSRRISCGVAGAL